MNWLEQHPLVFFFGACAVMAACGWIATGDLLRGALSTTPHMVLLFAVMAE